MRMDVFKIGCRGPSRSLQMMLLIVVVFLLWHFYTNKQKPWNLTKEKCCHSFLNWYQSKGGNSTAIQLPASLSVFHIPMSYDQAKQSQNLFKVSTAFLQQIGIQYFLAGNSLLGSFRHHNPIPWDDSLQIMIDRVYMEKLSSTFGDNALNIEGLNVSLVQSLTTNWKISLVKNNMQGWPYIEIRFYMDNGTHLLDLFSKIAYPKTKVFPLRMRPFGGHLHPAPCDTNFILSSVLFGEDFEVECYSRNFDHMKNVKLSNVTKNCDQLMDYYPFTVHTNDKKDPKLVREILIEKSEILDMYSHTNDGC